MGEALVSPYDLPENETKNLELIFSVLMKNRLRLGSSIKSCSLSSKNTELKRIWIRRMDKPDLNALTKAGFFELMGKIEKSEG